MSHNYFRQWADFWRVWWHCLVRMGRDNWEHRMCALEFTYFARYHFCNCGYLWDHVPGDVPLKWKPL